MKNDRGPESPSVRVSGTNPGRQPPFQSDSGVVIVI